MMSSDQECSSVSHYAAHSHQECDHLYQICEAPVQMCGGLLQICEGPPMKCESSHELCDASHQTSIATQGVSVPSAMAPVLVHKLGTVSTSPPYPILTNLLQSSVNQSHEAFISGASVYLDRLTHSLNLQNELVRTLKQMLPSSVPHSTTGVTDLWTTSQQLSQSRNAINVNNSLLGSQSLGGSLPTRTGEHSTVHITSRKGPAKCTSKRNIVLNGVTDGSVSKNGRYQRTHDVLKHSGLLDIAHRTVLLLKQSSVMDQEIATFKTLVTQHLHCVMSPHKKNILRIEVQGLDVTSTQHPTN